MDGLIDLERASAAVQSLFAAACVLAAVVSLIPVAFLIQSERSGMREAGTTHPILGKRLRVVGVSPIVLLWFFWLFVGLIPVLIICVSMSVGAAPISVVLCTALVLWLGPIALSWIPCCIVAMAFWCVDIPTLWRLSHGIEETDVRRSAGSALGEIVPVAFSAAGALEDQEHDVRRGAAVTALRGAFEDSDSDVRMRAAEALCWLER